jgi:hypothetical protein
LIRTLLIVPHIVIVNISVVIAKEIISTVIEIRIIANIPAPLERPSLLKSAPDSTSNVLAALSNAGSSASVKSLPSKEFGCHIYLVKTFPRLTDLHRLQMDMLVFE